MIIFNRYFQRIVYCLNLIRTVLVESELQLKWEIWINISTINKQFYSNSEFLQILISKYDIHVISILHSDILCGKWYSIKILSKNIHFKSHKFTFSQRISFGSIFK